MFLYNSNISWEAEEIIHRVFHSDDPFTPAGGVNNCNYRTTASDSCSHKCVFAALMGELFIIIN